MSWSVNAKGTPAEVRDELKQQFAYPLADGAAGLPDEGEKDTVRQVMGTLMQCLETFDPEISEPVVVSANGHMGWADYQTKRGAYQSVSMTIHLTR